MFGYKCKFSAIWLQVKNDAAKQGFITNGKVKDSKWYSTKMDLQKNV